MADRTITGGRVLVDLGALGHAERVVLARAPLVFKSIAGMVMAAGTAQSIWTPASGKKFRLMGWQISGSASCLLIFKVGASAGASVAFLRSAVQSTSVPNNSPPGMGDGVAPGVADDQLWIDVNSGTPTLNGFVFGIEES